MSWHRRFASAMSTALSQPHWELGRNCEAQTYRCRLQLHQQFLDSYYIRNGMTVRSGLVISYSFPPQRIL